MSAAGARAEYYEGTVTPWIRWSSLALVAALVACQFGTSTSSAPPPSTPPAYPPGAYGQAPPSGSPVPASPTPTSAPQAAPTTAQTPGPVAADPINQLNIVWLRSRAQEVYRSLVAALPPGAKSRVQGIPLVVDNTVGAVNAFASCTQGGASLMAITDGLLEIEAQLAQCAATDEIFGGNRTAQYIDLVARQQQPERPIVRPPPGFYDPTQSVDGRKVARQHQLFDEQVAFVMGHEMAHHYLGHLPCTAGNVTASEIGIALTGVVPAFNQVNEAAADTAGVHNVLTTGKGRQDYHWTEGGALLTMRFFAGMDQLSPVDILFGFERTHPPPQLRIPIIQQTAATWRATGGAPLIWVQ